MPPKPAGRSDVIKVVSSLPRTGGSKGQSDTIVNAIKMAIDEAGATVGSFMIEYEDWDDASAATGKWDAAKEADNANRAAADPDIMVYIGTFNSGAAKISIPILNKANLLMISPANTYPGLTKVVDGAVEQSEPAVYYPSGIRNYCRVVPSDELQGGAAANWAKEMGAQTVGVLDDTELYGHGIAVVFAQKAMNLGMKVVGPQGIDPKAPDYRSLALQLKSGGVDLVFFGGITDNNAGKLWQDLRSVLGPNVMLMGPDGIFEESFTKAAGPASEGTYITFGGVPAQRLTGQGADWYKNYKDKFNTEPEAYAAYGYESAAVVLKALAQAGKKDRETIRAAALATKDFQGVLGTWSFTNTGDTTLTTMSGNMVKGEKFEFVKLLDSK
ncbi:MAG: branched-chain amino acid ABC transporter substrate-binding protein [Chloroflexi bacterium]|nr:branched-chain amino acid ABC transporter substrate-binding protein [Chloroflexota bacterium]